MKIPSKKLKWRNAKVNYRILQNYILDFAECKECGVKIPIYSKLKEDKQQSTIANIQSQGMQVSEKINWRIHYESYFIRLLYHCV